MKSLIISFIRFFEKIDAKNKSKSNKGKIISSAKSNVTCVKSKHGYKKTPLFHMTKLYEVYEIKTFYSKILYCADNHLIRTKDNSFCYAHELKINQAIHTDNGIDYVQSIKRTGEHRPMYDLTIENKDHSYYADGIDSHNTITTSIYILYKILFTKEKKNILILANKGDTVKELLIKVKEIYKAIPFHLKRGISAWNQREIVFENNSSIITRPTSEEQGVGMSVDILYIDEFALIDDQKIRNLYKAITPTISNNAKAKMIISSTPRDRNLFYELYTQGKEGENAFGVKEIYWWQVSGRTDTIINIRKDNEFPLKKLLDILISKGLIIRKVLSDELLYKIFVKSYHKKSEIEEVQKLILDEETNLKLIEVADDVTNFRKTETKAFGEDAFAREYDLKFDFEESGLFSSELLLELLNNSKEYKTVDIPKLNEQYRLDYSSLIWHPDDKFTGVIRRNGSFSFDPNFYYIISIDLAPGSGDDYTVANIFKVDLLDNHIIEDMEMYENIYDFYCLKQVGMFRSNKMNIDHFARIIYILAYEIIGSRNMRIQLEINTYGNEFIKELRHINMGNSKYDEHCIFKHKHKESDRYYKLGYKVLLDNKNINIQTLKRDINNRRLVPTSPETIDEMNYFIKKETRSHNIKFEAEAGKNDDIMMTMVNMSPLWEHREFKYLLDKYMETNQEKNKDKVKLIHYKLNNRPLVESGPRMEDSFFDILDKSIESKIKSRPQRTYYTSPSSKNLEDDQYQEIQDIWKNIDEENHLNSSRRKFNI